jgi:uncharacterized protein YjcR
MAKSKLLEGFSPEHEVACELGVSVRTLRSWRQRRVGPPWTEMGKKILYRDAAIIGYLESQEIKPVRGRRAS